MNNKYYIHVYIYIIIYIGQALHTEIPNKNNIAHYTIISRKIDKS